MEKEQRYKFIEILFLLYFLVLPFIFFKEIQDPFLLARHFFTNTFLILVFLYIILKKIPFSFVFNSAGYFFLGFILIGLLSFFNATVLSNSHYIYSKYLTFFAYFMLLSALLYNKILSVEKLKTFLIYFSIVSLTIALLAIINKTINGQHLFRQVNMISGTFSNKNLLSSLLFCCLPFYFLGLSSNKKIRITSITAIILTVLVLIILRTRTVLAATSIFLFLFFLYELKQRISNRKKFRIVVIGSSITLLICFVWLLMSKNNFHSSSDIKTQYFFRLMDTKTLDSRTLFWDNCFAMIGDNLFTGVGLGNWIIEFPGYGLNSFKDYNIANGNMIVTNPHNDFLHVFCETGLIGIVFYIGIFATLIYQLISLVKNSKSVSDKKMFVCLLSFVFGYLVIAFFDFPLDRIEHQVLLLSVFAIVNTYYLQSKNSRISNSKWILFFFGIIMLYSTTVVLYQIKGEKHVLRMLQAKKNSDWQNVISESDLAQNYFHQTDTKSIPIEWYKATALFRQNQFEESNKSFLKAHEIHPNNITILNDLGSLSSVTNQQQKAIEYYKKALQISENYEDARSNLAAVYFNQKEYEKAFITIEKIDLNSKNENYKNFLPSIIERKLNIILEKMKNPKLNSYLQQKIKSTDDLIKLYFDSKANNVSFEKYIQSHIPNIK